MKKFLLVAALLFSAGLAQAAPLTATFGDQNSSKAYRLQADTTGTVTYASDTSVLFPYSVATTNQTLTVANSGSIIVFNNSASTAANGTMFTLPTAAVGMQFTIISDIAKFMYIKPASTDTINFSTATAGQRLQNITTAAAGDSISLFCASAGNWSVVDKTGTWAVSLPN